MRMRTAHYAWTLAGLVPAVAFATAPDGGNSIPTRVGEFVVHECTVDASVLECDREDDGFGNLAPVCPDPGGSACEPKLVPGSEVRATLMLVGDDEPTDNIASFPAAQTLTYVFEFTAGGETRVFADSFVGNDEFPSVGGWNAWFPDAGNDTRGEGEIFEWERKFAVAWDQQIPVRNLNPLQAILADTLPGLLGLPAPPAGRVYIPLTLELKRKAPERETDQSPEGGDTGFGSVAHYRMLFVLAEGFESPTQ